MNIEKVCGIEITNPNKIIDGKIKKIDIIKYYEKVAPYILRYLKGRPISEIRCHCGFKDCFFSKHPQNNTSELWHIESKKDLILHAQLGSLEFHPYGCKLKNMDKPDIMIFDLDPDENLPLKSLRQGVLHLKNILDELKLISYLKTSGGKGYHIVIPFKKNIDWQNFESFSQNIAKLLQNKYPDLFTTNIRKSERKGKIFVDYLRNKKGATCVAPFSLRARKNLPISFPISWEDLDQFSPNEVNIMNFEKYL